jgi:hypothetical protein
MNPLCSHQSPGGYFSLKDETSQFLAFERGVWERDGAIILQPGANRPELDLLDKRLCFFVGCMWGGSLFALIIALLTMVGHHVLGWW